MAVHPLADPSQVNFTKIIIFSAAVNLIDVRRPSRHRKFPKEAQSVAVLGVRLTPVGEGLGDALFFLWQDGLVWNAFSA